MALVVSGRRRSGLAALFAGFVLAAGTVGTSEARAVTRRAGSGADSLALSATAAADAAVFGELSRPVEDSLFGRSGKLRARLISHARAAFAIPIFQRLFGDTALGRPGLYAVHDSADVTPGFTFIALRPFTEKNGGWLGRYHIGFWPAERGRTDRDAYANPDGFIEVTADNQETQISEHFRLRDFLTHDQAQVWPKYLVLREDLVDKLELVIAQLKRDGHPVQHMAVMSGFRTPQYNSDGGETGGRAELSRHMYGDAADVFVDNNGDGRMDDLNHDGRIDYRDARVILRAVEEVEQQYPDLTGGVGVYRATRSHGPFAHVDVRGWRARWGRIG